MKVTVLIPTLNEEEGIGHTLDMVDRDAFASKGWDLEYLIIDGDSKDATKAEAEKRGARVVIDQRKGYGRAYKTGFTEATGDIIITADADGTYPLDRAHEYVQMLLDMEADFLTCDRYAEIRDGAMSGKHRLGNFILTSTTRVLFGLGIRDSQSGMWVIRKAILERMPFADFSDGMPFSQEIKIEAMKRKDIRAYEVAGSLDARIGEAVIETWGDGFGNLKALFAKRFTTKW